MKLTIQCLLSKYALHLVFFSVLVFAFSLLPDLNKRLLGQFLTVASYMVVGLLAYARLQCPRARISRAFKMALRNDFRMLRCLLRNRIVRIRVIVAVGSMLHALGAIAQVYSNQVADKPVLMHFANPLICIVLFWIIVHPKTAVKNGTD